MPRRTSESARILRFFNEESLDKVEVVYELAREIVKARKDKANPAPQRAAKRKPAKRSVAGQTAAAMARPAEIQQHHADSEQQD